MTINKFAGLLLKQLRTEPELSTIGLWTRCGARSIPVTLLFSSLCFLDSLGLAVCTRKDPHTTFYRITAQGLHLLRNEITDRGPKPGPQT